MLFVSGGTLVGVKTPLSLTNGWFPYMPGMSSSGGWPSAYSGIFGRHLWVYVVVTKLARGVARLPLPVYTRDDLNRPRADGHPMARLLASPNPGWSSFDMWLWVSATFDIYGDTFLFKRRRGGVVESLWPFHPSSMTYDEVEGWWTFDNGRRRIERIPSTDLIRFKHFNPDSSTRGLSPLEPLRATLENEWNARTATSSFWRKGARPGMALMHKANLSEAAMTRLRAQVDQVAAGSDNHGGTLILEEGMEPKTMSLTAEEAQYIETRKLNREEVCAAYDVPPPVVHILDRATFSNITEQMRSMYRDTQAPRLNGFEAAIETDLRAVEWPSDAVYAEFLMDEVLRGDFEQRQGALAKATHMTIAEKRRIENLPFIPGTDRIFLNTATLPLDAIDAQTAANMPAAGMSESDVRSVLGRLSWQSDLSEVDPRVLVKGVAGTVAGRVLEGFVSAVDVDDLKCRVKELL